ncbi:hypothetical protein SEA_MASK_6 [Mycobacterium phage Mask]|nr:hypothetical protein SEA_SEJANUS_6 [Mycobacterium phage Sejanus]UVT31539.1 hypothetical protein SEA_MASK_6 [Mycobacterium phage Mask]
MNLGLGVTVLVLVVYVLAVARVTRLINYDVVLDFARLWIARRAAAAAAVAAEADEWGHETISTSARKRQVRWNLLAEFAVCPWCVGWWVALVGAVPVVIVLGWSWWALVPVALACSYLVGLVAPLTADEIDVEQA